MNKDCAWQSQKNPDHCCKVCPSVAMERIFNVLLILSVVFVAHSKVAHFTACDNISSDKCSVSEVRIEPCSLINNKCAMRTNINSTLSFDFTPNFDASRLKTMVYYQTTPFASMETDDACGVTTCPTVAGRQQVLTYTLPIGRKLPVGIYPINWKVWDADNQDQICCFKTTIQLKR